jgi:hypothetical protein
MRTYWLFLMDFKRSWLGGIKNKTTSFYFLFLEIFQKTALSLAKKVNN